MIFISNEWKRILIHFHRKEDVFVCNIPSLNNMRSFESKPNTKIV